MTRGNLRVLTNLGSGPKKFDLTGGETVVLASWKGFVAGGAALEVPPDCIAVLVTP